MKKLILLFCLCCFTLSAFSQKENKSIESAVLQIHQKKFEWMVNKQYDSLSNVLDNRLAYIHSNGWMETKQEVIADLRSGKLNYTAVEISEATARSYKSTVIVNGKGSFSVLMDGKPLVILLNYTEVYVKNKKGWKLASRHANKI